MASGAGDWLRFTPGAGDWLRFTNGAGDWLRFTPGAGDALRLWLTGPDTDPDLTPDCVFKGWLDCLDLETETLETEFFKLVPDFEKLGVLETVPGEVTLLSWE